MKKTRVTLSRSGVNSSVVYHKVRSDLKEDKANKISQIRNSPDDEHYPTEKLLYTSVANECKRAMIAESNLQTQLADTQKITRVQWGVNSNINKLVTAGIYSISGERLSAKDGLPIRNSNPGHSVAARLTVLDSSINTSEVCVTQILELSNRMGADANIFIRTGTSATGLADIVWADWQKLQGICEMNTTATLDKCIDNGMYSGVLENTLETFILVVINNYLPASVSGGTRSIAQLKYSLGLNGNVVIQKRVGKGNDTIVWGDWEELVDIISMENRLTANATSIEQLRKNFESSYNDVNSFLAKQNLTLINYNLLIGSKDAYTKSDVISDLFNKGKLGMGIKVCYYSSEGWKAMFYDSVNESPSSFLDEHNWKDVGM